MSLVQRLLCSRHGQVCLHPPMMATDYLTYSVLHSIATVEVVTEPVISAIASFPEENAFGRKLAFGRSCEQ